MSEHGFIDPMEPHRQRIQALEAQVAALSAADRRPEHDSGDYYTFTKDELDAHDEKVRSQAAASQVQGAAEVGADVAALAERLYAQRDLLSPRISKGGRGALSRADAESLARVVTSSEWLAERVAEARAEGYGEGFNDGQAQSSLLHQPRIEKAEATIARVRALAEFAVGPDGEPLPEWVHIDELRRALDGDQGGGLLDEDGGA